MYNRKIMEKNQSDEWLKDLPLQTEDIRFKPEEMVGCAKCRRMNPPNRLKCFYCGGELAVTEAQSQFLKFNLRKLESWEKGCNVIFLPSSQVFDEAKTAKIAEFLKAEKEVLRRILASRNPLPLVRVESEKESAIVQTRLQREFRVETFILSDKELAVEQPTRRLRGIEFFDDKLVLIFFNQNEITEISSGDLALIVAGAMFERRIEATEKYNKKGDNEILSQSETASDETLIDIYNRTDTLGFRIYSKGFDFSCLAAEKEITAKDNIKKLAEKLRRFAPGAKFVDDYVTQRSLLANVWEVEQKTVSQGLKRESFGRFNLGNLTTVNNTTQFTKYSRLQRHLL
jgi:hypothetical protein